MIFEKENDNRRGDHDAEEQADQRDEQHQAVHLWREVGRLLRIQWQLRLHGLVGSSFMATAERLMKLGLLRASIAATENQNPHNDAENRQDSAQADDPEDRRAVSGG